MVKVYFTICKLSQYFWDSRS